MATAAPDKKSPDESGVFNCTICLERFTKPKYLPCLHTFCEACLNTYIMSTQSGQQKPVCFNCPVCRQEVKSPDPKAPMKEWADLMPLNYMIFSLMESPGATKTEVTTKCSPCERDGEIKIATFWCLDCCESLCDTCTKHHKRNKLCTTHEIIEIFNPEKSRLSTLVPDVEESCPLHKRELLKVYCEDHKDICCVICFSVNHRKCNNIKTFDQMAESMKMCDRNMPLVDRIGEICTWVKSLVDRKIQNIDIIQTQQQDILKEASGMVEQAKKHLDKCHEELKTRFSQIHEEQITKLINGKDDLETFHATLLIDGNMLKAELEHGSPKQIFITSENIKKQLKIQWDSLRGFLEDDKEIVYDTEMDDRLTSVTKMTSLSGVKVKNIPYESSVPLELEALFCPRSETSDLQRQLKTTDIAHLGAAKLWDVNRGVAVSDEVPEVSIGDPNYMKSKHNVDREAEFRRATELKNKETISKIIAKPKGMRVKYSKASKLPPRLAKQKQQREREKDRVPEFGIENWDNELANNTPPPSSNSDVKP